MQVLDKELSINFGLCDFVLQHLTLNSQDLLRLLISQLGSMGNTPLNLKAVMRGLVKAIDSFANHHTEMTIEFYDFHQKVHALSNEVSEIYSNLQLIESTLIQNKLFLRKWDILERTADESIDSELLRFVGAYYCLQINQHKVNKNTHQHIYKIIIGEKEFLSESAEKELARLLSRAGKIYSSNRSFEETINGFFYYRQLYANDKQRQSVNDWHTVSESEFIEISAKLFAGALDFNPRAILVATSVISGLPSNLCLKLRILDNYLCDWTLGVDVSIGVIKLDLDQIFKGKAHPRDHQAFYKDASSILIKPLPKFLHEIFKQLIIQVNQATTLGELLQFEKVQTKNLAFNESKFINSVARFAIHSCNIDQYEACLLANDFRSIPASKTYYRQTTRQKIWEATSVFYQKIGWSDPVSFIDGLSVGSKMVSKDETVVKIFSDLAKSLENIRPSNHTNLSTLLNFHDHFCAYTATLAIFCLALRNANPIKIFSADYDPNRQYLLIDDKHVMGDASRQPVVITSSLSTQLKYWHIHCQQMIHRLNSFNYQDACFIKLLEGVVTQKKSPLFFLFNTPFSVSTSAISKFWTAPLVENFPRHFWESKFGELGVNARFSSAHLRHQVSGNLNWSSASDLVLTELIRKISLAQEAVLVELGVKPIHGLSRRVSK